MSSDPLEGRSIEGRWVVGEPIGRGGMSTVYLGHDELDGTPVAIKTLKPGLKPELRSAERFRREARAASRVEHPNVISIAAHGELDDGQCYLVMEHAEGVSLQRAIRIEAPFGPRRVLRVARQIVSALARAHAEGVLHRDLKPANVVLSHRRGEPDFVKVLDFGLAKIIGHDEADTLTKAGLIFGTPEYMSPEQAVGQAVDGRCDLYALGAMLYEMLVGWPPFRGEGVFETVRMQVAEHPLAPRDVRSDISVPPMLEGVVLRCLEKRPEDRFESADHLGRVLAAVAAQLDPSGADEDDYDSGAPDSREATMTFDRAVLLDADEAARAEFMQLRRHRQETLRRAGIELESSPSAPTLVSLFERIDRLEQLGVDRGADLAVADSAAEEARGKAEEHISGLRLEYIDRHMEATQLREVISADEDTAGAAERLAAIANEIELLAAQVHAAERALAKTLGVAKKERQALAAKYADAEDAIDECYDEVASHVRASMNLEAEGELGDLISDLDSFDRWIAAHQPAQEGEPES